MVVDNRNAAGRRVIHPADAFQLLEGQQNIDAAFLNQRRVDFFGEANVADDAAAALRHAECIGFFDVITGGERHFPIISEARILPCPPTPVNSRSNLVLELNYGPPLSAGRPARLPVLGNLRADGAAGAHRRVNHGLLAGGLNGGAADQQTDAALMHFWYR